MKMCKKTHLFRIKDAKLFFFAGKSCNFNTYWHSYFKVEKTEKQAALSLAIMQEVPGVPSFDPEEMPYGLLKAFDTAKKATTLQTGQAYLYSSASVRSSFGALQVAARLNDLDLAAILQMQREVSEIDKTDWEQFWQLFNLVQQRITIAPSLQPAAAARADTITQQDILDYYDAHLHPIVLALLEAGFPVNPEGDFFLEEEGSPPASASLGIKEKKIFIDPHSEEDRQYFLHAGYREMDPVTFDINSIL